MSYVKSTILKMLTGTLKRLHLLRVNCVGCFCSCPVLSLTTLRLQAKALRFFMPDKSSTTMSGTRCECPAAVKTSNSLWMTTWPKVYLFLAVTCFCFVGLTSVLLVLICCRPAVKVHHLHFQAASFAFFCVNAFHAAPHQVRWPATTPAWSSTTWRQAF